MEKSYKNKRDQFKAERDDFERELNQLKRKQSKKKEGLSCIVYCENCQLVYNAVVPNAQTIKASGCAHCGVRGVGHLVKEVIE